MCEDSFYLPIFWAFCASVFGFILKSGRHGWKLAIGISVLLPCNLLSVSPISCSQPEASGARNLWGSVPCNMGQSRSRERKRPEDWYTLLGCVPTGIVFRECWSSLGHIPAVRWWNGGRLDQWDVLKGRMDSYAKDGLLAASTTSPDKIQVPSGKTTTFRFLNISLTLNEPVRSLSEQGLNGVGKKSEKLFVPWEVEEHGQKL